VKKIGFIDYYLDEFHADKYPAWIEQATGGAMHVAYAYGLVDKKDGLSNEAWCAKQGIQLLDTIEEVVERSDYLVVLSPDHPEFHEELASIPLRSGKPTYVDKTFAPDRETAIRMFEWAEKHGTPMYSSSALRFAKEYGELEREGVNTIESWGAGQYDTYAIHQIEPIVQLMGPKPQKVMYTGTSKTPALLIDFGEGKQASIHHLGQGCPFTLGVAYENGSSKIKRVESDFFFAFIQNMVKFFESGKPIVDSKETIAIITIIEYGREAAKHPFKWIELS